MQNIKDEEYKELYGKKFYWDLLVRAYGAKKNKGKTVDPDLVMEMARLLWKDEKDQKLYESYQGCM